MPHSVNSSITFRSALPGISIITGMYFLNFLARGMLAPLLVPMEEAFGASHGQIAGLMLFLSGGFGTSLVLSGFVASRIRHRTVIALAIFVAGISLFITSMASSIAGARLGFALFGMGTGLYLPSGMAALASVSHSRFWGRTVAIHELAPNVAFILAPLFAGAALTVTDWRGALQFIGVASVISAALFVRYGRGGHDFGQPPGAGTIPKLLRRKATWAFMVLLGVGVGLESGPYSITPLFLVAERGMAPSAANSLLATSRLITPVAALAGGWLADRLGVMPILTGTIAISAASLVGMGFAEGTPLAFAIMLQASMPAIMFPVIFKALVAIFGEKDQSLVLSLTMPVVTFAAIGGIPAALGWCGDLGSFGLGFAGLGALTAASLLVLPMLRE